MRMVKFNGDEYEVVKGHLLYMGNTMLFDIDGRLNIILPINLEDGEDSIAEILGGCEIIVATTEDVGDDDGETMEMYYDEQSYRYRINGIEVIPAIVLDQDIHNSNRDKEIQSAVDSLAGENTYSHCHVNMAHTLKNVYIHFDKFVEMSLDYEYEKFLYDVKNVLGKDTNIIPTKNVNCAIHAPSIFLKLILSKWGSDIPDDIEVGYDETEYIPRLVISSSPLDVEVKYNIQTAFNSVGIVTEFKIKPQVYIDVAIDEKVEVFIRSKLSVDKTYLENKDYKSFIKEYVAGNIPIKPGTDVEYTYLYDTVSEPKSHTLVSVGDEIVLEELQVHVPYTIKPVPCEVIRKSNPVLHIIRAGGTQTEIAITKKTAGDVADMVSEHILSSPSSTPIEVEAFYLPEYPDKYFYGYVIHQRLEH